MQLRFKKLDPNAKTPTRAKPKDSGLDLYARLDEPLRLEPGQQCRVNTGIAIELPPSGFYSESFGAPWMTWEAQVRPRSGMTNRGLLVPLGTVDNGYRGDVGVVIFNNSFKYHVIRDGDRIAQLVVCPVVLPELVEVEALSETERGSDGFGSTGV